LHRTVAFDVYGTLFDLARLTASCEEAWPGYGQTLADMWRRKQLEYSWQRSLMRRYAPFDVVTREALEYSCKALGVELNSASKRATMSAYAQLAPYADALELVDELAKGGCSLAVLSNGTRAMVEPIVRRAFGSTIATIASVDSARMYKPAPEAYEVLASTLGTPPPSIVFVTANAWDAAGASAHGMRVVWVNRTGVPIDPIALPGVEVLPDLGAVLKFVLGA
jgi:2-haloacid dehalogenase